MFSESNLTVKEKLESFMNIKAQRRQTLCDHRSKLASTIELLEIPDDYFPSLSDGPPESEPSSSNITFLENEQALEMVKCMEIPMGLQSFDLALNPEIEREFRAERYGEINVTPDDSLDQNTEENIISSYEDDLEQSYTSEPWSPLSPDATRLPALPTTTKKTPGESNLPSISNTRRISWGYIALSSGFSFTTAANLTSEWLLINKKDELPWLEDRLDISSRSIRFSIPFDVFDFETMRPLTYLQKYCFINSHRENYYMRCITAVNGKLHLIARPEMKNCILRILHNLVKVKEVNTFLRLFQLGSETQLPVESFVLICGLAERVFYVGYANIPQLKRYLDPRDFLERADFNNFQMKIQKVFFKYIELKILLFSLH